MLAEGPEHSALISAGQADYGTMVGSVQGTGDMLLRAEEVDGVTEGKVQLVDLTDVMGGHQTDGLVATLTQDWGKVLTVRGVLATNQLPNVVAIRNVLAAAGVPISRVVGHVEADDGTVTVYYQS